MSVYQSTNQLLGNGESLERMDSFYRNQGNTNTLCIEGNGKDGKAITIPKSRSAELYDPKKLIRAKMCRQLKNSEKVHLRAHLKGTPPSEAGVGSLSLAPAKQGLKNLIVLGVSFMFVFTAFVSLKSVQSTLNHADGIGVISLGILYATSVISCFISPWTIHKLGTKGTICIAFVIFAVYVGTNFYPQNIVLIVASVILGLLKGPLWSAQSTYLTTLAYNYASVTGQVPDLILNKFNGIFTAIFETSQIWGNLVTAFLLSTNNHTVSSNPLNQTLIKHVCGAKDCGHFNDVPDIFGKTSFAEIPAYLEYVLLGIYFACVGAGLILSIVLLEKVIPLSEKKQKEQSSKEFLLATFRSMKDVNLVLLIPLVFFIGLQQGFIIGDYTRSYVNCSLGVHHLGFTMVCFGSISALTSITIGHIGRHIKRFVIMGAGAMFHIGLLAVLVLWTPDGADVPMFYVLAGCLGLCDAIWHTQSNRLFGLLFSEKQEAAFANYRMFHASGHALAFGYSYFLCVDAKIYILGVALVISLAFYGILEIKMRKILSQTYDTVVGGNSVNV